MNIQDNDNQAVHLFFVKEILSVLIVAR